MFSAERKMETSRPAFLKPNHRNTCAQAPWHNPFIHILGTAIFFFRDAFLHPCLYGDGGARPQIFHCPPPFSPEEGWMCKITPMYRIIVRSQADDCSLLLGCLQPHTKGLTCTWMGCSHDPAPIQLHMIVPPFDNCFASNICSVYCIESIWWHKRVLDDINASFRVECKRAHAKPLWLNLSNPDIL